MNDWGLSVLNRYPLTVRGTRKVRGALLCDTADGWYLLQEYRGNEKRLEREAQILSFVSEKGGCQVDNLIADQEGKLLNRNEDGTGYILKRWYMLSECSVSNKNDLYQALRLLAKLHLLLRQLPQEEESICRNKQDLCELYEKHTRELRRVRAYLCRKKRKTPIEECIMNSFSGMYDQADSAVVHLKDSAYRQLADDAEAAGWIYHGAWHQHNILIGGGQIASVNYEHFGSGLQMEDLYHFMRKILEKHNWNPELGLAMLNEYERILPLTKAERNVLYAMFEYPEKYWKQVNFYFNGNKTWIAARSIEKIQSAVNQYEARVSFLKYLEE